MDWLDSASIGDPPVSVQSASLSTLAPTGASVSDSLLWRKVMQLVALNVKTEKIILLSYSELQKFNYPFWLIHIIGIIQSIGAFTLVYIYINYGIIKYRNRKPESSVKYQYVCQWIQFVHPIYENHYLSASFAQPIKRQCLWVSLFIDCIWK